MARVADVKGLLGKHVPQARQMLRKLIDGRVVCTHDARGKGYEVTATGSTRADSGSPLRLTTVAEREGFEPSVEVLPLRRFSKPLPSATRPPLHGPQLYAGLPIICGAGR